MSAQDSGRAAIGLTPALASGGAVLLISGGVLVWAVAATPLAATPALVWLACAAVALLAGAAAAIAYLRAAGKAARARVAEMERQWQAWGIDAARFEHAIPEVGRRLRDDQPVDDIAAPGDPVLRRLLYISTEEMRACVRTGAQARAEVAHLRDDLRRLREEWVPELAAHIPDGRTAAEEARDAFPPPAHPDTGPVLDAVLDALVRGHRLSAATLNACRNAGARLQAATRTTLALINDLQHKHGHDETVLGDLMQLDHQTAMTGRLADTVVVLAGGRTGRRWTKPIRMESILRGAMSRIKDYKRVRVQALVEHVAVSGHAAEGVMHLLAEVFDNAANFSPPPAAVAVYVEDVDAGAVITVEDSGLGMRKRELSRAQQTVADPGDMTALPGTRLGLPVVGRLAEKHDMEVHFRPSSRGGTGVVVMIPRHLLIELPREDTVVRTAAPAQREAVPATAGAPVGAAPEPVRDEPAMRADGLPQRRRGATLTDEPSIETPRSTAAPSTPKGNPASTFSRFRRALGPAANPRPASPSGAGETAGAAEEEPPPESAGTEGEDR